MPKKSTPKKAATKKTTKKPAAKKTTKKTKKKTPAKKAVAKKPAKKTPVKKVEELENGIAAEAEAAKVMVAKAEAKEPATAPAEAVDIQSDDDSLIDLDTTVDDEVADESGVALDLEEESPEEVEPVAESEARIIEEDSLEDETVTEESLEEEDLTDIVDDEPAEIEQPKAKSPSLKLYRRIAIGFVVITAVLLAVVLLLSTIKASITVLPRTTETSTEFIADVVVDPDAAGEIPGRVLAVTVEEAKDFSVSAEGGTEIEGQAGGLVTLYNTSATDQPLVATTRLLSEDEVLFRIDEAVTVPAGGSVQVMAHADESGAAGDIDPTTFTIPGLNSSRQQEVYAESTEAMTGGVQYTNVLTEAELDAASEEFKATLLEAAKVELSEMLVDDYSGVAYDIEELEKVSDTTPGTETETFTLSMKLRVVAVYYDQEELAKIAEAKLFESLPQGNELVQVNRDSIKVEIERFDVEEELANIRVELTGSMIISPTSGLLNKDDLVGLTAQEVSEKLIDAGVAVDVEVIFSPFFVKKVPRLKDHIDIQIKTQ